MAPQSSSLCIVACLLALTSASCRSSAPEKQEQRPEAVASKAGAPVAIEWSQDAMENHMSRVGYGSAPKGIVARGTDGALTFTPQTPQDHLATNFIPLGTYDGERSIDLSVQAQSPGGDTCAAILQDQGFNDLASVPCRTAGEQHATVKLTRKVTGVRVYFMSVTRAPIRLPVQMRLIEQR